MNFTTKIEIRGIFQYFFLFKVIKNEFDGWVNAHKKGERWKKNSIKQNTLVNWTYIFFHPSLLIQLNIECVLHYTAFYFFVQNKVISFYSFIYDEIVRFYWIKSMNRKLSNPPKLFFICMQKREKMASLLRFNFSLKEIHWLLVATITP